MFSFGESKPEAFSGFDEGVRGFVIDLEELLEHEVASGAENFAWGLSRGGLDAADVGQIELSMTTEDAEHFGS